MPSANVYAKKRCRLTDHFHDGLHQFTDNRNLLDALHYLEHVRPFVYNFQNNQVTPLGLCASFDFAM
jgi:hypothetical protein